MRRLCRASFRGNQEGDPSAGSGQAGGRALVLELVDGPTLADRIAQEPIAVDEAVAIARQIADALEVAHEQGIIHRDLKPANIKVREDGTVKVLDFGLAKALEGELAAAHVSNSPTLSVAATRMGVILGTAAYMAPEQAKGKAVDKRADIGGFGSVLFEMLSGQQPFAGETVSETLAEVMKSEPRWDALPDGLPPRMMTILRRCLEKNPIHRLRDIGDVRLALDGAFDAPPGAAETHAASLPVRAPLWRRVVAHASTLVVGAVIAGGTFWTMTRPEAPRIARFQVPLPEDVAFTVTGRQIVALSADGRLLAYVANNQLYLRPIDQLEATPVRGTVGARSPPDRGRELVRGPAPAGSGEKLIYVSAHHAKPPTISAAAPNRGYAISDAASRIVMVTTKATGPRGHSSASPTRAAGRASIMMRPHATPATYTANPNSQNPTPKEPTGASYLLH